MSSTTIETVRLSGEDGRPIEYAWDPSVWYIVCDRYPFLDIFARGNAVQLLEATKSETGEKTETLQALSSEKWNPERGGWQRWNFERQIAYQRRLGEMSLRLKVPKDSALRVYVIPSSIIVYSDIVAMLESIESEFGIDSTWQIGSAHTGRVWAEPGKRGYAIPPSVLAQFVLDEVPLARAVRRNPFRELGPRSRQTMPLAENALVSHWAFRRTAQLQSSAAHVLTECQRLKSQRERSNAPGRQDKLRRKIDTLVSLEKKLIDLKGLVTSFIEERELSASLEYTPLIQRDHRLRYLLRSFAPFFSETLSETAATMSHHPPVVLNNLWELWGAIWLARQFQRCGFVGNYKVFGTDVIDSCSWHLQKNDIVLQLDFEPGPTLIDYGTLPPAHERSIPAFEWAAQYQEFDEDRPFLGSELACAPDYVLRITTPTGRHLIVGDACLASPKHHGGENNNSAKPHTVEEYRRTIAWVTDGEVIRCHPMGGFVLFPPPAESWEDFQSLKGAGDCTILCPNPRSELDSAPRLLNLLVSIAPELRDYMGGLPLEI